MKTVITIMAIASLLALGGCGGPGATKFVHPAFDFGYIERVAVVPFENLSNDQGAGARAFRYLTNALLASETFDVVEPGEVTRAMEKQGLMATAQLTAQQSVALGRDLRAQGLFLGSVSESAQLRSGSRSVTVVTIVIRLVETETGATVWSVTNTEDSSTFWSSLFGTQQKSSSEVMRECIDGCLETLFD